MGAKKPAESQHDRAQRVREHQQPDVGDLPAEQRPEDQIRDGVDDHQRQDEKAEDVDQ